MDSLRGQLLIASTRLGDPNFARTVILIVQHDENGAVGLVLNRPLEISVKEACREVLEGQCAVDAPLYHGGPCPGPLMAINRHPSGTDREVATGVYFTSEIYQIEPLLRDQGTSARFFIGYAGWSAGQLEAELKEETWLTAAVQSRHLFESGDPTRLWSRAMTEATIGKWIDPERLPDDPSLN
jgi:putative transcriptional regulator